MVKAAQDIGMIDKNLGLVEATQKFFKLQEQGQVISEKILPQFAKRMKEFAATGLADKLNGNTVAMGRFNNTLQSAQDIIFKSGFGKGLTELFNELAISTKNLAPLWEGIGAVVGSIFHLIAQGVKAVTPTLISLGSVLKGITQALGEGGSAIVAMIAPALWLFKILKKSGLTGGVLLKRLPLIGQVLTLVSVIKDAAFWAEELMNVFTQDKIGILFDPRNNNNNAADKFSKVGLGASDNTTMGGFDSVMASLMNIFASKNIGTFVKNAVGETLSAGTGLQVILNVDGEQLATNVASTDAMTNAVDYRVAYNNN